MVQATHSPHNEVFGEVPERDSARWFSDGSALTGYGIETVNHGTLSGLPGAEGENLAIEGLADTARVYASSSFAAQPVQTPVSVTSPASSSSGEYLGVGHAVL